jgi:hypothetical protein
VSSGRLLARNTEKKNNIIIYQLTENEEKNFTLYYLKQYFFRPERSNPDCN